MNSSIKNIRTYTIHVLVFAFTIVISAQSEITSEEILLKNDSIVLPGTLTYNKALKIQPLVIFIHGSGNVDRNGNQAGVNSNANYIKLLSDSLNQKGIAFYRYDKRTATMRNLMRLTSMEVIKQELVFNKFVEDAILAINNFKDDSRFSKITLIGHSQGSLVAMLASKIGVDKYISLAGPSNSIHTAMVKQMKFQGNDSIANIMDLHFKELKNTGTIVSVDPSMVTIFSKPNLPFFKSWSAYIPSEEIKKVTIPTLILNGTKDLQVFEDDATTLKNANLNSELVLIKNMNHVLKRIMKDEDNLKSYNNPDFPLSTTLVKTIETFIKK